MAMAVGVALGACVATRPLLQFDVQQSPGFVAAGRAVSVLGVYENGRMSPRYWRLVGAPVSKALGAATCEPLFYTRLAEKEPALFAKLERYAMENGIDGELLGQVAGRADGASLLLLLSVVGRPLRDMTPPGQPALPGQPARPGLRAQPAPPGQPSPSAPPVAQTPPPSQSPFSAGFGRRGGGGGRGGGRSGGQTRERAVEDRAYVLAAELFSPTGSELLARLELTYRGHSLAEALTAFLERLRETLPSVRCAPWRWPQ